MTGTVGIVPDMGLVTQGNPPSITGVHDVKLPTSDVSRSRDWYVDVFGFMCALDYEEEDCLAGAILEHPAGVTLGLHRDAERARALRGFDVVGLCVNGRSDLDDWSTYLSAIAVDHTPVTSGHLGWVLRATDPDGIFVRVHTMDRLTVAEA